MKPITAKYYHMETTESNTKYGGGGGCLGDSRMVNGTYIVNTVQRKRKNRIAMNFL